VRVEHIGDATLYLADCRDVLPTLDRRAAIVTDPPYGISYQHGSRRHGLLMGTDGMCIMGDGQRFDPSPWLDFAECLFWGAEHFKERLPAGGRWLVWDKRRLGVVRDQGCIENAWHSTAGVTRIFRHPWDGADMHTERGQVRVHSNQKPVDLMAWCLEFTEADLIVDPFMGSGTTILACRRAGLRCVGIECDPLHFNVACHRVTEAYRQGELFTAWAPAEPPEDERMRDLFADLAAD